VLLRLSMNLVTDIKFDITGSWRFIDGMCCNTFTVVKRNNCTSYCETYLWLYSMSPYTSLAHMYVPAFCRDFVQGVAQLYSFRVSLSHVEVINLTRQKSSGQIKEKKDVWWLIIG
jgi:hypothetical protein